MKCTMADWGARTCDGRSRGLPAKAAPTTGARQPPPPIWVGSFILTAQRWLYLQELPESIDSVFSYASTTGWPHALCLSAGLAARTGRFVRAHEAGFSPMAPLRNSHILGWW